MSPDNDDIFAQLSDTTANDARPTLGVKYDPFMLAATMLIEDRRQVFYFLLLFFIPSVLSTISHLPLDAVVLPWELLKRAVSLYLLFTVCKRWFAQLQHNPVQISHHTFAYLLIYGFAFWFIVTIPALLMLVFPETSFALPILFFILAIYLALTYYFYFLPIMLGHRSATRILSLAKRLAANNSLIALRVVISPIGITLLLTGLIISIAPDGRDDLVNLCADFASSSFAILSTYIGVAFGLLLLCEQNLPEFRLAPYAMQRLDTLTKQAPTILTELLRVRSGIILALLGIIVWTVNDGRAAKVAPSPTITVRSVVINDQKVTLDLELIDDRHHFQAFKPIFLRLAGENGAELAAHPIAGRIADETLPNLFLLPRTADTIELSLDFQTDRKAHELRALEDLYLWYRQAKLTRLEFVK